MVLEFLDTFQLLWTAGLERQRSCKIRSWSYAILSLQSFSWHGDCVSICLRKILILMKREILYEANYQCSIIIHDYYFWRMHCSFIHLRKASCVACRRGEAIYFFPWSQMVLYHTSGSPYKRIHDWMCDSMENKY